MLKLFLSLFTIIQANAAYESNLHSKPVSNIRSNIQTNDCSWKIGDKEAELEVLADLHSKGDVMILESNVRRANHAVTVQNVLDSDAPADVKKDYQESLAVMDAVTRNLESLQSNNKSLEDSVGLSSNPYQVDGIGLVMEDIVHGIKEPLKGMYLAPTMEEDTLHKEYIAVKEAIALWKVKHETSKKNYCPANPRMGSPGRVRN